MNAMGFPAPAVVMASTDQMVVELRSLSNLSGKSLGGTYAWQELTKECVFTSTAAYDQGLLDGYLVTSTGDYSRLVPSTLWNRSAILQASGPVTSVEWQADVAFQAAAPYPKYRIWQGSLWIGPVGSLPTSGDTWAFEYISNFWCQSAAGVGQTQWVADTDTGILDEELLTLDIIWRWKASKSIEYADDLANFEDRKAIRQGQTTGARALYVGGANVIFPINIPEGNWPTS
jgi:hypothetical protein